MNFKLPSGTEKGWQYYALAVIFFPIITSIIPSGFYVDIILSGIWWAFLIALVIELSSKLKRKKV